MNIDRQSRDLPDAGAAWPRAGLRTRLVAIILAATLPLALFMSARTVAQNKLQREALATELRSAARAVAMVVERELAASREALAGLAEPDALQRGDRGAFEQRLRARAPLRPGWGRLAVLDASGGLLFEVDGPATTPPAPPTAAAEIDALARAWAARPSSEGVLLSVLDGAAPQRATWIGSTVTTAAGARYLLAARVGPGVWQALLDSAAPGGGSEVALFDAQHRVLAHTGAPEQPAGWSLPASAVAGMASRPSGSQKTGQLGGGETYVGWQSLGDGGWSVGVGIPAAAFDAAQRASALWTFGVAAAGLLLGVILSVRVARRVDQRTALEQAARKEAEAAGRTKDRLLGVLGHELRNPLNAIVTSVEVLRAAEPGSSMADSARGVLTRQVRRLTGMVDELAMVGRAMAEQITLAKRPVELRALVGRSVEAAMPLANERKQRLRLDAAARVWVDADAGRIAQAMALLLENAIEHTPAAGTVVVRLALTDGMACVSVEDSGPGIGLALVGRLVELHGGSVQAPGSAQGGSCAWRLPAIAAPAEAGDAVALRIGLVDDNADALASLRALLELEGHRVSTAVDGPTAVAMLLAERPQLALVDIALPGFDGREVARRCRAAGYGGRMVAVSGYGQADDLERSLAEGFDAHLVKPLDLERLLPLLLVD